MRTSFVSIASLFISFALIGCSQSDDKKPAAGNAAGKPTDKPLATPADKLAGTPSAPAGAEAPVTQSPSSPTVPAGTSGSPSGVAAKVDLRFVPAEAFAAFIAFPQRVLASGEIAKLDFGTKMADFEKHFSFSPRDCVQLVSFAVMTPGADADAPPHFGGGMEVVLSKPYKSELVVQTLLEPLTPEESEVAGKKYFRQKKDPAYFGPTQCVAAIDDTTFLLAEEPVMKLMLSAKDTKSPLTALIGKLDSHADLAVIATNSAEIRKLVDAQMKAGAAPPQLAPYAAAPT